jgi:hypothetical protein
VATLGIALATGVAALLGLERLLAAATASGLLLLAMSALGGFVLVLRNNSR